MRTLMILSLVVVSSVSLASPTLAQQTGVRLVTVNFQSDEKPRPVRIDFYRTEFSNRRWNRQRLITSAPTTKNGTQNNQVINYDSNLAPITKFDRVWVQLDYRDSNGRLRTYVSVQHYGNFTGPGGPPFLAGSSSSNLQP